VELTRELVKKGAGDWIALLEKLGIPASRINGIDDLHADPQVVHRRLRIDVPHPSGTIPMLRSPLNFSATPVEPRPAPLLGQHTDAVLRDVLGLAAAEIGDLRAGGIV
jgi:crotonobetainyl-CoA:carnitine CoA-transferase CaiB-like acyl-CoA transferase